jgi:predicted TPR repeat methyltransferase
MSRFESSLPASYFDELYARDADPWRFASSPYEREKYAATIAALPRDTYTSALEIGCSIGVLTRQLAARADTLCAIDVAARPLVEARRRCADLAHVRFEQGAVPAHWPEGRFDLIVLSEVVYYLDRADVAALAARVHNAIVPGGDILLVHWLGETHYPLSGDEAVALFTASTGSWTHPLSATRHAAYRLDLLRATAAT